MSLALHGSCGKANLGKDSLLELSLRELHRTDVQSDLVVQFIAVIIPHEPRLCQFVVVALPYQPLDSLLFVFFIRGRISPNSECTDDFFLHIPALGIPYRKKSLVLGPIHVSGRELGISPLIEVLCEELSSSEKIGQALVLDVHFNGFERLLVPLFEGNFLFELAKSLNDLDELLQSVMALFVKSAVGEKFVQRVLLALLEHLFEQLEHDFGNEKFVVMAVMRVHLPTFPRDFRDTVVISTVQLIELCHQVVSLRRQPIYNHSNIVVLSIIL